MWNNIIALFFILITFSLAVISARFWFKAAKAPAADQADLNAKAAFFSALAAAAAACYSLQQLTAPLGRLIHG